MCMTCSRRSTSAEVTLARVCGFCQWAKEGTKIVTITGAGDGTGALKHGVTSACTNLVLSKTGQLLSSPPAKYLKATQPSSIPTPSSSSCYEHWHITGAADCDCVPAPPPQRKCGAWSTACPFPLINLDFFFVNKKSCIWIANIKFTHRVQLLPLLLIHCAG